MIWWRDGWDYFAVRLKMPRFVIKPNGCPRLAHKGEAAFTLVELSIVLVIVGLLIGGILAAQSMIGTAKINGVIKQLSQYDTAISNFKTKYGQLPGDSSLFPNPGNNNGLIDSDAEIKNSWNQLSLGVGLENRLGSVYQAIPNGASLSESNCPKLNIDQNTSTEPCLYMRVDTTNSGTRNYYYYKRSDWYDETAGDYELLKPIDASTLDNKLDDNIAVAGKVIASGTPSAAGGTGCFLSSNPQTYNITGSSYACALLLEVGMSTGGIGNDN